MIAPATPLPEGSDPAARGHARSAAPDASPTPPTPRPAPPIAPQERLARWWRTAVIVAAVLPFVVSFRRDVRRWLWWGGPATRAPRFHEARARRLVVRVAALGPAFVKLAQMFAARADLVPEPYLSELATLTDRVPPEPWARIASVLEASLGRRLADLEGLDDAPLAAGSLGQVHRARVDGAEVVVKVLRPGIDRIVRRDAAIALAIMRRVYRRLPHHHVRGTVVLLEEFAARVEEEMDFRREARQCTAMRARFAGDRRLRIPRVFDAFTTRDTLVLEFLEGNRIDALDARLARGDLALNPLVEHLIATYSLMMLRDGVFHADPHPGNLLVAPDGALVLLDFGMVIDVPQETRSALFRTVLAAVRRDAAATADGFYALGMVAPGTPRETMVRLVDVLLGIAYDEDATTAERAQVVADRVMHELFAWPIVLPGELVYFARTAALIEGVGARYDPRFNSIAVATPVVLRLTPQILTTLADAGAEEAAGDPVVRVARQLGALAGLAVSWWRRGGLRTPTP